MSAFRVRQWGSADWTHISISGAAEEDDELQEFLAETVAESLLGTDLHVQRRTPLGEWEDLDASET
jgi:hypothetical protein